MQSFTRDGIRLDFKPYETCLRIVILRNEHAGFNQDADPFPAFQIIRLYYKFDPLFNKYLLLLIILVFLLKFRTISAGLYSIGWQRFFEYDKKRVFKKVGTKTSSMKLRLFVNLIYTLGNQLEKWKMSEDFSDIDILPVGIEREQ